MTPPKVQDSSQQAQGSNNLQEKLKAKSFSHLWVLCFSFAHTMSFFTCMFCCQWWCLISKRKVLGPQQPLGEAQGKELQPPLGTLLFFCTHPFFFTCMFFWSVVVFDFEMKGTGTSTTSRRSSRQRASTTFQYSDSLFKPFSVCACV